MQEEGSVERNELKHRDAPSSAEFPACAQHPEGMAMGIVNAIDSPLILLNKDLTVAWANEAAKSLFGDALAGNPCHELFHHTANPCMNCSVLRTFRDGVRHDHETSVVDAGGIQRHFWCTSGVAEWDAQGRPARVVEVLKDITQRKQMEDALRASRAGFHSIVECSENGQVVISAYNIVLYANRSAGFLLGLAGALLPGTRWTWPMRAGGIVNIAVTCTKKLEPCTIEMHAAETAWNGEKAYLITLRNISEKAQADKNIERMAAAIDQLSEAVVITDPEGIIKYVNPAFERITGYAVADAPGQKPSLLKSGKHDDAFYKRLWETISRGEVWRGHIVNKKKDGTFFEEEATITPLRDDKGQITEYLAVKRDVTHVVTLEAQLRQAQKLEAIGTLAGGIAHDFNNILSAVLGYAELGRLQVEDGSPVARYFDEVIRAGERAAELVRQILTFSRQGEQERQPVRLGAIVKEALKLIRGSLPTTIEIYSEIDENSPPVVADPIQMHQVLMNLCTNAFHAMEETGGTLTVRLDTVSFSSQEAADNISLREGRYVRLSVEDTGYGMDEETRLRIFEPFFTTKPEGKGTGLGLSTVHGIVTGHGGAIEVQSVAGQGTRFQVFFPVMKEGQAVMAEIAKPIRTGDNELILLVDDDRPVLSSIERQLTRLGYRVHAFTDALEAYETFRNHPELYDAVVTDHTMPKMTGLSLARTLFELRPGIPILLITGTGDEAMCQTARDAGIRMLLPKPVGASRLSTALHDLLASGVPESSGSAGMSSGVE